MTLDESSNQFVVDTLGWRRADEVVEYALRRRISLSAAIRELVNSGLNHESLNQ